MIMPVDYMYSEKVFSDNEYALKYSKKNIQNIWGKTDEQITNVSFPLGLRPIKINTMLSFDGFRACITRKANSGQKIGLTSMMPLVIGNEWENYIKKIDNYIEKKGKNKNITLNEKNDGICGEKNEKLYCILTDKIINNIYSIPFNSQQKILENGYDKFKKLDIERQVYFLQNLVLVLKSGRAGSCDMSAIGGSKNAATFAFGSKLSLWAKKFQKVYLIDNSSSGIYQNMSDNLLDIIK